ncbi:mucin-22-like [Eurosta solidaginis]|uniref:mucin-22-like n=1 Tax=Eurosta solidaginis TaxID=178769 RepID=UPI00353156FB
MSKIAITLLLLGTAACVWQPTEAKPFFLLPPNFFVLTTRAPSTDIRSSSYTTSSSYEGNFQLPTAIISKKISFITSPLSILGGVGGGGAGAGGSIGGGCGIGFNLNATTTTSRPKTTAEPNNIFPTEASSSTKAPENNEGYSSISTEKSAIGDLENNEKLSTTTGTEKSVVYTEVEVNTATGDVNKDKEPTTSTERSVIDVAVVTNAATIDLANEINEPITSTEKTFAKKEGEASIVGNDFLNNNKQSKISSTEKMILDLREASTSVPINTKFESTTTSTTSAALIDNDNESTTKTDVNLPTESTATTDTFINIQPTVVAQLPAIITKTTANSEIGGTSAISKDSVTQIGANILDPENVRGGFEIITVGGKDDTEKAQTVITLSDGIGGTASGTKVTENSDYNDKPTDRKVNESHTETDNEIFPDHIANQYLPVA